MGYILKLKISNIHQSSVFSKGCFNPNNQIQCNNLILLYISENT